MSDDREKDLDGASLAFAAHLEKIGFFAQIKDLEENLKSIAEGFKSVGETATRRLQETESLAAHLIAVEAILSVVLKSVPVEPEDIAAAINERTAGQSKNGKADSAVRIIAGELISGKKD